MDLSNVSQQDILLRLEEILQREGVRYGREDVEKVVTAFYPDIRKMVGVLESSVENSVLKVPDLSSVVNEVVAALLSKNLKKVREAIKGKDKEPLYRLIFDSIGAFPPKSRAKILLILAEYLYRHAFVIDKEINFIACAIKIMGTL